MPEEYAERPPTITAQQFAGTQENALQMNNWLSNYGAPVMYDSMRNRLVVQTPSGAFLTVENTDWVVMDSQLKISSMTNSDFEIKYEPISGDIPQETPPVEPDPEPEEGTEDPPVEEEPTP